MSTATEQIEKLANTEYKYGFVTDTEQDIIPIGLDEDVVRLISSKKGEPEWMLEWRLKAFRAWATTRRHQKRRSSTAWTRSIRRFGPLSTSSVSRSKSRSCYRTSRSTRCSIRSPLPRPSAAN